MLSKQMPIQQILLHLSIQFSYSFTQFQTSYFFGNLFQQISYFQVIFLLLAFIIITMDYIYKVTYLCLILSVYSFHQNSNQMELTEGAKSFSYSPDFSQIVVGLQLEAKVFLVKNAALICSYKYENYQKTISVKYFPTGDKFVLSSGQGQIKIISSKECSQMLRLQTGYGNIENFELSNDGKKLVICTKEGKMVVWNINPPQVQKEGRGFKRENFEVESGFKTCKFTQSGEIILGLQDKTAKRIETKPKIVQILKIQEEQNNIGNENRLKYEKIKNMISLTMKRLKKFSNTLCLTQGNKNFLIEEKEQEDSQLTLRPYKSKLIQISDIEQRIRQRKRTWTEEKKLNLEKKMHQIIFLIKQDLKKISQEQEKKGDEKSLDKKQDHDKNIEQLENKKRLLTEQNSIPSNNGNSGEQDSQPSNNGNSGEQDSQPSNNGNSGEQDSQPSNNGNSGEQDSQPSNNGNSGEQDSQPSNNGNSGEQDSQPSNNGNSGEQDSQPSNNANSGEQDSQPSNNGNSGEQDSQPSNNGNSGEQDSQPSNNGNSGEQDSQPSNNGNSGEQDSQPSNNANSGEQDSQQSNNANSGEQDSQQSNNGNSGEQDSQPSNNGSNQNNSQSDSYESSFSQPALPIPEFILLQNFTVQQFFTSFFQPKLLSGISYRKDIYASTLLGSQCNTLITKVNLDDICQKYHKWSDYIKIIHPRISQNIIYCTDTNQPVIYVNSTITGDISDPKNISILLPSQKILSSSIVPSIPDWRNLFTRISAGYQSTIQPAMYDSKQCQRKDQVLTYLTGVFIIAGISSLISIGSAKIVGLQLFGLLQIAYFNLANHGNVNINLFPLSKFSLFNGFNLLLLKQSAYSIPASISNLAINSEFLNNFNIMGLASAFILLTEFTIYKIFSSLGNQKWKNISLKFLAQSMVTLAIFNSFNIAFSSGVHFTYSSVNSTNNAAFHYLGSVISILMLASLAGVTILFYVLDRTHFGQFKQKFKNYEVNRFYVPFTIIYRVLLGFYISSESQDWKTTMFALGIQLFILIAFFSNLPYNSVLHNYRAATIHLGTFCILLIANYYGSMKLNTDIQVKSRLHNAAFFELAIIGICVAFSLFCSLYQAYSFIKDLIQKRRERKIVDSYPRINATTEGLDLNIQNIE